MRTFLNSNRPVSLQPEPFAGDATLREMEGYEEIGMHHEALQVARRILRQRTLTADEFKKAVLALLTMSNQLNRSFGMVERAYERLRKKDRRKVRREMLCFYSSVGDHAKALAHATFRPQDAQDFMFSLDAYGKADKKEEVRRLMEIGRNWLRRTDDAFVQNAIWRAIVHCAIRRPDLWEIAEQGWADMPAEAVFCREKFGDRVRIHAAHGLKIVQEGLHELVKVEMQKDPLDVSHPGLTRELLQQAREELARFQRALERILPRKDWKHFGMETEDPQTDHPEVGTDVRSLSGEPPPLTGST